MNDLTELKSDGLSFKSLNRRTAIKGALALIGAVALQPISQIRAAEIETARGRFQQVGDSMSPTIVGGDHVYFDFTDRYEGEGLYVLGDVNSGTVYRAQKMGNRVRLLLDSKVGVRSCQFKTTKPSPT